MEFIIPNKTNFVNRNQIQGVLELLSKIDKELSPLIKIILSLLQEIEDDQERTYLFIKLLKFYGIGNDDILTSRLRYYSEDGMMIKKPFLKNSQKDNILDILNDIGVKI